MPGGSEIDFIDLELLKAVFYKMVCVCMGD